MRSGRCDQLSALLALGVLVVAGCGGAAKAPPVARLAEPRARHLTKA
jgi:hypothetical protein